MKYILTENQLSKLLKRITGSEKNEPTTEVVKNEIENLDGKTVSFEEIGEDGEKIDTNVYKIKKPKYEVIDTGKKLRGLISFYAENLQERKSMYNRNTDKYLMVNLIDGKVMIYGLRDEDFKRIRYKNEKLEYYLGSILDKFPIFWKDKETPETDF